MNDIPVHSRKYETVRCLADKIIDENLEEGCEVLHEVNRTVLSNAFARTLRHFEAALLEQERERVHGINGSGSLDYRLSWVWNAVRVMKDGAMSRVGGLMKEETSSRPVGWSADKFAAEILWLAQKLIACANGEEAVSRWGSASSLALLALSADPRIQGTMVKVSALLFKHVKEMGAEGFEWKNEEQRERKKSILTSWLPFLCQASIGIDTPVLSNAEKMELERVLEQIIETLKHEDEQEKVLALWLHHFTSSPLSDWPNLQACYSRWCSASRKLLVA
ncbi:1,8-cineole synthase [Thalictrum thalictroides]|uniref:1,8-cineole synthase n=1 Tax=Thalictrum thalictroides TaxID=46969 RepID=A0A7J6VWE4_THATH|nr:1,8-cineole synthase [Thalictrum thalictroides]